VLFYAKYGHGPQHRNTPSKTKLDQLSPRKQVSKFYHSHSGKSDDLHQMSSFRELMP